MGLPVPKERRANQGCKECQAFGVRPASKSKKDFQSHLDFQVCPGKPERRESEEKGTLMALTDGKGSQVHLLQKDFKSVYVFLARKETRV